MFFAELVTGNPMTREPNYSIYALRQLLQARHWIEVEPSLHGARGLEEEIHRRCAYSQEPTRSTRNREARYRPYGLLLGVAILALSIGPVLVFALLDIMDLMNPDDALLWSLWALLTLPFAVIAFLLGGIMDAERIVKRFGL
jgi:hypothetical protein